MEALETENSRISDRIDLKKDYYASVQTNAYIDRVMKSSQNRKNPGESAIFLVDEKEVADYKKLETDTVISERKTPSKTFGMTNREKWGFYLFGVDTRK